MSFFLYQPSKVYNLNMLNNRDKILELAQQFDRLCKAKNIWYSLDKETLLGAIRHGGFVPWAIKFEVMVTAEGLAILQREFSGNIVNSSIDQSFKSLTTAFVEDAKKWQHDQAFIEIRVVVPTTADKYVSYRSKIEAIKRVLTFKKDNIKHAIDDLFVQKNEGFILIDHSRKTDYKLSWIQVLTFKTKEVYFSGLTFPVFVEYDTYLKHAFGENYIKNHAVPHKTFIYPAPLKKVGE